MVTFATVIYCISACLPATLYITVGVDYTSTTFAVSLLSGETSVCTDGTLIEDDEFEGTESFYLIFINSNPSVVFNSDSGGDGSRIQTQIFIVDNSGRESEIVSHNL